MTQTSLVFHQPLNNVCRYRHRQKNRPGNWDVVFLLSPWVMSSSFRLCLHDTVAALSIHCLHGDNTASATSDPLGAERSAIGQMVWLTAALPSDTRAEWCHWKDRTEAEMCIKTQSVTDLLLTHQLNKADWNISRYLWEGRTLTCCTAVWSCFRSPNECDQFTLSPLYRMSSVSHPYICPYVWC